MKALLVIDVQNDFCPGGALAVPQGASILPRVHALMAASSCVVLTQDWHPPGHASFASTHGAEPFSVQEMAYGPQVLWPDHCVQGSTGAAFHPDLRTDAARLVVRKGFHPAVDSYSAFRENDRATTTGLAAWLRGVGVHRVELCGLATDYCVAYSALDAAAEGFDVAVHLDACRGIDPAGVEAQLEAMRQAGVDLL